MIYILSLKKTWKLRLFCEIRAVYDLTYVMSTTILGYDWTQNHNIFGEMYLHNSSSIIHYVFLISYFQILLQLYELVTFQTETMSLSLCISFCASHNYGVKDSSIQLLDSDWWLMNDCLWTNKWFRIFEFDMMVSVKQIQNGRVEFRPHWSYTAFPKWASHLLRS